MTACLQAMPPANVQLLPGPFLTRFNLNRGYLMRLRPEALLQNHLQEAGFGSAQLRSITHGREPYLGDDMHWGWESPTCQVRGHFLGHWLSAAARICATTGDAELKAKADRIVSELGRCQRANGGEWVGSIPEKYLSWIAEGKGVWAPQYTLHKTLMGLHDMHVWTGSEQALDILVRFARWFHRWTSGFSRQQMDDILDFETGGMLETWADLYGITGRQEHADLIERYSRGRLFDRLLAGEDPLTNRHANTTIPEAQGAARAYEVTGDERWRRIAEAYWHCAVTDRGCFCTGGQTSGEVWTPPFAFVARLGEKTQEHCTVYDMIRLADYLFRWTGDVQYADYIERNLYNGILAQQHPATGAISYFLPLEPGARKHWGSETNDFWCCHGTLVQAHTRHNAYTYYATPDALTVAQYIPSRLAWETGGTRVVLTQTFDSMACSVQAFVQAEQQNVGRREALHRPEHWTVELALDCDRPVAFDLRLRLPWWLAAKATITVNGEAQEASGEPASFHCLKRTWHKDTIRVQLPKALTSCPLPDEPGTVAFMDGPVVLAGLCDHEPTLVGDAGDPSSILAPANEREWATWLGNWRTVNQERRLDFRPLHTITDEPYTVCFPVRPDSRQAPKA